MSNSDMSIRPRIIFLLLVIVILAGVIRFIDLEHIPVGGDGDAAWIAMNALDWIDRGVWPYYVREMYAPEPWTVYLIGLVTPFVGISNATPRVVTALSGVLMVALLFPATWWLLCDKVSRSFRERASLLAALSGAVSLHAMHLSRLGVQAPNLPMTIVLTVWLTAWAWRRGRWWRWLLAGAALALTQYIYISGRMMPLVLILWFAHSFWSDRDQFRQRVRGWVLMAVTAFILVLPNLITFISTPEAFTGRADSATAATGGLIWNYDLEAFGGIGGLLLQKLVIIAQAFGIYWAGPYTGMGQPMLAPLFFIGLLIALPLMVKRFRWLAFGWPLLAIPVLILPDFFSGAVAESHSLRQIGVLPFALILSALGLTYAWNWLEGHIANVTVQRVVGAGVIALAVVPSLWGMNQYLNVYTPQRYADPETSWRTEQTDVDISRHILEQPDRAYLVPYDEYSRANVAWLLSGTYRQRQSGIAIDGILHIPNPPETITVITATDPYRARHDARPSVWDPRLWVLLDNGTTYLLPPLTLGQEDTLLKTIDKTEADILLDRSNTEVARFYTMDTPADLFAPRDVVDYPMDAVFRLPGENTPDEIRLVGYTLPDTDLTAGELVYITLFWQPVGPINEDYEIFVQIWNDAEDVITGTHDFPYSGSYRSRIWKTDEIVPTHHWVQLPEELPVARYTLAAGLFRQLQNEPLLASGDSVRENNTAALARDLRYPAQPISDTGTPPPTPLQFGDLLKVAGLDAAIHDVPQSVGEIWQAEPGENLTLVLTWDVLVHPPVDYSLFLHLTNEDNAPPAAQADIPLGTGSYPSGAWRAGDKLRDRVTLNLPDTLTPGEYALWMGIYYYADGSRLTPLLDNTAQPDGRVRLATVVIK